MNKHNSGFTLVEMAVVTFIIGLLIVGVMAGKNLIEGGKIRGVLTEMDESRQAMLQFQEKYFDWPGDLSNASALWPGSFDAATGEGDGDEKITWMAGEGTLMWGHLEAAQMIGQTGFNKIKGTNGIIGTSVPGSKIAGAGWYSNYTTARKNYLGLGAQNAGGGVNSDPAITPKQAYDIDSKMDDGVPTSGSVQSDGINCYTGFTYNTGNPNPECTITFTITNH